MPAKKYRVVLEKSEVALLEEITKKGKHSSRVITRARTLLMTNENSLSKIDQEVAKLLNITKKTVKNIRQRYCLEGIKRALYDKKRPGQPRKLTSAQEAEVTAIACTDPPDGHERWTLELLTEKVCAKVKKVGKTTIYRMCLRSNLKPWREKNVVYT